MSSLTLGVTQFGESSTAFGVNLYKEVIDNPVNTNVFISPVSISLALSMVMLGAKGDTAAQLLAALQLSSYSGEDVHLYARNFLNIINAPDKLYQLSSANRLYGRIGYDFREEFLNDSGQFYKASLERLDFSQDAARETINTWVEQQTNEKIKNLIPFGLLDASTVMVLVNAIYFKGTWVYQFDKAKTSDSVFYTMNGDEVRTEMMQFQYGALAETTFNYTHATDLNSQVLELPYKGWDVNMYIFLPDSQSGLSDLENQLTAEKIDDVINNRLYPTSLDSISIPKFKMEFHSELIPFLQNLGIMDLFGPADLSGIGGSNGDLSVSAVVHKAFVDVNEEGTEAAAATAVVMTESAAVNPLLFIADHPFLFLIRQRSTRSTLFMGRLVEPASDGIVNSSNSSPDGGDPNGAGKSMQTPFLLLLFVVFMGGLFDATH